MSWAYAKLQLVKPNHMLFLQLAATTIAKLPAYNSQDVSNTLWAFASNDVEATRLFLAVAEYAAPKLRSMDRTWANPQKVATLAWSYAKAAVYAPDMMAALAFAAEAVAADLLPVDVANIAWAFAAAGETDRTSLFDCLKERAGAVLEHLCAQELANLVWSFAGLDDAAPCARMWEIILEKGCPLDAYDDIAKSQLQQAYLRLKLDPNCDVTPLPDAWEKSLAYSLTTCDNKNMGSRTQEEVSSVLLQIGWQHEYEYFEKDTGLSLDMAQVSTKTAVEFDGPIHYFTNEPWMLTGRSKLKRRLMDLIGWDVVYVDYRTWDEAPNKVAAIFDAFAKHGVDPNMEQATAAAITLKPLPALPANPVAAAALIRQWEAPRLDLGCGSSATNFVVDYTPAGDAGGGSGHYGPA